AAADRVALVDRLAEIAAQRARWEADQDYCARILADDWRGERTEFVRLLAVAEWAHGLGAAAKDYPRDRLLALAQQPETIAALRRTLREAEPVARQAIDDIQRLLDLDPRTFGEWGIERAGLAEIVDRLRAMAEATDRYAGWVQLARLHAALTAGGVPEL